MGKRGPKQEPTALKLVKGTRADRINSQEPQPSAGEIVAPAWLGDGARSVWDALAADLEDREVLTFWDCEAFATYCDAVDQLRRAKSALAIEGEIIEAPVYNRNGDLTGHRTVPNPWMGVKKDAIDTMKYFGARFGLTPSDRADLKVGAKPDASKAGRLLSG